MDITADGLDETVAWLDELPTRTTVAMARGLNRGITSGRTVMTRSIANETDLASSTVRNALPIGLASATHLEATLAASLKRIPLQEFHASGPTPSRGRGRGVTYRIGGAAKTIPNAFIATMSSSHQGVFRRIGKRRLPILELFGPSLGHVFNKYVQETTARAQEIFENNVFHDLGFDVSGGDLGAGDA
jgi:hypothetical protein